MSEAVSQLLAAPWLLAGALMIVFFAAIVQIVLGMGFGLTAAPLLALLDPALVPAPILALGVFTAGWGAWRERDGIRWPEVGLGTVGRFVGVLAGTAVLALVSDTDTFLLVFGLMIGLAVALSASGLKLPFNRLSLLAMCWISGLMGTITSVGAPPLALIYQHRQVGHARPTMSAFFSLGCLLSLAGLFASGWAGAEQLLLAAMLAPAMLAGLFAAGRLRGRFDARFRPLLLAISGTAAVMLVLRGLA